MDSLSSSDSEGETDSDEFSKEKEEELYSVLHHNDFSQGIPPELLEKYCIQKDENNEILISFRKSMQSETTSLANQRRRTSTANSGSSSDDDIIVLSPPDSPRKVDSVSKISTVQNRVISSKTVGVNAESALTFNKKSKNVDEKHLREFKTKPNPPCEITPNSQVRTPKKRKLSESAIQSDSEGFEGDPNSTLTPPLKIARELVVEHQSDSDSSCVVVENPEANRKISISSTESVLLLSEVEDEQVSGFSLNTTESVLLLSEDEDEEVSGFSLNTTEDVFDSDGNVSDVIETSQFEWDQVASPSTWTREMKKYYNRSCDRLRYFDHKKIRQQIKTGSRMDWLISPRDRYPNTRQRQRCLICRQSDHLARNCPKQDPPCHMCGIEGHSNTNCPNSICLQCGKKNSQFTSVCRSCTHTLTRECFNCKKPGHESRACPEKWREFHSTTEGPLKKESKRQNRSLQCCNCGKATHTFDDCNQQPMSNFAKSLPAYNWLSGKSGNEDWRVGFSGFSPRNKFVPPFKKRKHRYHEDDYHDGFPRWTPISSNPKPKKKKKKNRNHKNKRIFLP